MPQASNTCRLAIGIFQAAAELERAIAELVAEGFTTADICLAGKRQVLETAFLDEVARGTLRLQELNLPGKDSQLAATAGPTLQMMLQQQPRRAYGAGPDRTVRQRTRGGTAGEKLAHPAASFHAERADLRVHAREGCLPPRPGSRGHMIAAPLHRVAALWVFLGAATAPIAAEASSLERGRALAAQNCARCHATGSTGDSPVSAAPPFRVLPQRYPVENLAEALAEGIVTGHPEMPEFKFAPADIDALLGYIDSLAPPGARKSKP
jgi:cytochrome c